MSLLTQFQTAELARIVARWRRTEGTYDYPDGDAIRSRAGKALAAIGLVELGNRGSANRYPRWRPTPAGVAWVESEAMLATGDWADLRGKE